MSPETRKRKGKRFRARIRHAAMVTAPMWLTRGRLSRLRSLRRVHLVERELAMPGLPDALDGMRITHLSDLHVGDLIPPSRLPALVAATNKLQGDLIAVTGDFIDLKLDVLDKVIDALSRLRAPLGVFLVPGNHDYLEDGPELLRRFRKARLSLLVNQAVRLEHKGCPVLVAGIDFAHEPRQLAHLVHQTMRQAGASQKPGLRLLLSHHPDAFDAAGSHGIDLTLSGHTHGGQVLLFNHRGAKGSLSLGGLGFQYPRGLYRRGHRYLYVSSGVGAWFPWRLRCPAEIAVLTLRSEPDPLNGVSHP